LEEGDYEVKTVPANGEDAVYPTRPIRLDFRDARTDKLFACFGQRLVLRLVDERGQDLFEQLAFIREHATDLPEYQRAWRDVVLGVPCALPGLDALWSKGVAHFSTLLGTSRRYDGMLVMLPTSVSDLTSVANWDSYPVVYRFRFNTSKYLSFSDHVAAHKIYDEICDPASNLAALTTALGSLPTDGRIIDDVLLESVLADHLHLAPRTPPGAPEVVRIWQWDASTADQGRLVALLLDGPEPLIRADAALTLVIQPSTSMSTVQFRQASGARTLILFPTATGFDSPPSGDLIATLDSTFIDANGVLVSETASLTIPVPTQIPTLSPEPLP
jgi:hypothetical protein